MIVKDIYHAQQLLQTYIPPIGNFAGDSKSIERMLPLLSLLGNPHQNLRVIHVAGTSGKTSTCYYLNALLSHAGKKTGMTVSPHVDLITERVQINGEPISEKLFCDYLAQFLAVVERVDIKPTYFELLIAFSLWVFFRLEVEYAVIETGMGGLLDGTNVVTSPDKVCVITDIGLDHMHLLGNTVPEIAFQKVGIVHNKNQVFFYDQGSEITEVFKKYIQEKDGIVNQVNHYDSYYVHLPDFQNRNFNLAKTVCDYLAHRDRFKLKSLNLGKVLIPARMEVKKLEDGSVLIMDGAHNQQKMETFVASFQKKYGKQKAVVMIALKKGKEYKEVVDALRPIVDKLLITTFTSSQDLPSVSQDPGTISEYAKSVGLECEVINENYSAYKRLLELQSDVKIITGSFYLISQIRTIALYKNLNIGQELSQTELA